MKVASARVRRIALILAVLALVGFISAPALRPALERVQLLYQLSTSAPPTQLRNPVEGVASGAVVNTWGAPRLGGRRHEGIDIFAPRDTPVLSTTRGLVTHVGTNTLGGQVVWILGPGLESHYYAHLDRFGDIHRGDMVNAGDVIGYVGRTGNARGTPFHLHYGIYRHGKAENPYPRLANMLRLSRDLAPEP
jgi:murein DD-endopeptidase MepM/ murein hydrolase activator NlpD